MPSAPRTPPLAFVITFTPRERGEFNVSVSPDHPAMLTTIEDFVRGYLSARADRSTTITAYADRSFRPDVDGPIGPKRVRTGLLQLAEIGASELADANRIVQGYLYDVVVGGILGSMREQGIVAGRSPTIEIDDSPIPQLRTVTRSWWHDVQHVVVGRAEGATIRLRGIPRNDPFANWANARILASCRRRFAAALGVPPSALIAHPRLQAV